ncbi:cytochrome P450 [Tilletiaria anomala UBC 951]|uniref:Cytochrome P450 n=1 Tax=Tilletiaria anomala (strain ATCC 24038 / CBS 436.72 / UBC 951) TaxID=1037660 RepID=A0A066VLN9_TILAU|nr:cytochrome P450 [Tilletiaria anomala UBC 951]KDN39684.1 cytochrome P450 [Tilletiaria anomala UBC 951]
MLPSSSDNVTTGLLHAAAMATMRGMEPHPASSSAGIRGVQLSTPICLLLLLLLVCVRQRIWPDKKNAVALVPDCAQLSGPDLRRTAGTLLWGHYRMRNNSRDGPLAVETSWAQQYGAIYRYKGFFNADRIVISDPRLLHHLHKTHSTSFPKPTGTRRVIEQMLGHGIITSEGPEHRRQRLALEPLFSPSAIRRHYSSIDRHARILAQAVHAHVVLSHPPPGDAAAAAHFPAAPRFSPAFAARLARDLQPAAAMDGTVVDVMHWASRCTLDMLGSAIFGATFDSASEDGDGSEIDPKVQRLHRATADVEQRTSVLNIWEMLGIELTSHRLLPAALGLKILPTLRAARALREAVADMAKDVLERMKLDEPPSLGHSNPAGASSSGVNDSKAVHQGFLQRLMSVKGDEKLSDDDIIQQLVTLIIVGHETTSTALSWTLHCLARHPEVQEKLRGELRSAAVAELPQDGPARVDTILHRLPYWDKVVREALRLYTPVPVTRRQADHDTVVPLRDEVCLRNGARTRHIAVRKGTALTVHSWALHRDPRIWGADAHEFNPDRPQPGASTLKSQEGCDGEGGGRPQACIDYMPFLVGSRSCVGQRFALLQLKLLLFHLVTRFDFRPLPNVEIGHVQIIALRPLVKGFEADGGQLPLLVRALD